MTKWSKAKIDKYVEDEGGCPFNLIYDFPFSESTMEYLNEVIDDEETYSDSDVADIILDCAYEEASKD